MTVAQSVATERLRFLRWSLLRSLAFLVVAALSVALSVGLVLLLLDTDGFWRYSIGIAGSLAIVVIAAGLIALIPNRQIVDHEVWAVVWRALVALPLAFFGPWKPLLIPLFVIGILLLGDASAIAMVLARRKARSRRFLALVLPLTTTALLVLAADWIVLIRFLLSIKPESF